MTPRLTHALRREPSAALAAVAGSASLVLFLLWQNAMDRVAPFGLGALAWFEALTPLDRQILSVALLVPGVALWLLALRADGSAVDAVPTPAPAGPPWTRRRRRALGVGLGLVVLATVAAPLAFGPNGAGLGVLGYGQPGRAEHGFQPVGTLLWLCGGALFLWAVGEPGRVVARLKDWLTGRPVTITVGATVVAVVLIAVLAGYFRFYDLDGLPYEMTSDHTEKLLDVRAVVDGGRPTFLPLNGGREPLQFYWTAFLVWLGLPLAFLTLKSGMAVVSTLTVPAVFWLGRAAAGRDAGLLAALALALAPWHLQITRIGLRTGFSAFFAALCLWLLLRALERGRRNDWLALALVTAVGMYGYSGFRPMPIVIGLAVAVRLGLDFWRARRTGTRAPLLPSALAGHLAAAFGAALVALAPLLRYAMDRPEDFWGRTVSRVSGAEVALARAPLEQLAINMKSALLMFHTTSDAAWFHSPPARPALETVGGALLLAGALTALARARRGDWRCSVLLLAVPVMLLSSAMALAFPVEVPHLSRASGALPAVVVLVALPLPVLGRLWRSALGAGGTWVYGALLAALFLPMAGNTTVRVFQEYRAGYDGASHPTRQGAQVARAFLRLGGDLEHVYLVSWPHGWDYRALGLLLDNPDWRNVMEGTRPDMSDAVYGAETHYADPSAKLYLVGGPQARANIDALVNIFPGAVVTAHASRMPGKDFWSVYVPPASSRGAAMDGGGQGP